MKFETGVPAGISRDIGRAFDGVEGYKRSLSRERWNNATLAVRRGKEAAVDLSARTSTGTSQEAYVIAHEITENDRISWPIGEHVRVFVSNRWVRRSWFYWTELRLLRG